MKILVPVDGSKPSLNAFELAVARASGRSGAEVHVLFVESEWEVADHRKITSGARFKRLQSASNARVHVVSGEPASGILAFARKNKVTEIVMGTRGLGELKRLLLGSVAAKVVQLAPIPVTIVK